MSLLTAIAPKLMIALGCGLLIGLERERRKGDGPTRLPAGIRTFALAALSGALARSLDDPWLVIGGALALGAVAAVATFKRAHDDPGLTTALALQVTYLLGVLSVSAPLIAAGSAVVVTVLLAARGTLHRFSTAVLSEQELRDGLLLAAVGLIAIPLAPDEAVVPWITATPQRIVELVLIFMSLQALSYIAQRIAGERLGIVFAGLLGGVVSSTATITAFGARARLAPDLRSVYVCGALASNIATILLLLLIVVAVQPQALSVLALPLLAGLAVSILAAAIAVVRQTKARVTPMPAGRAFHLGHAIGFALALAGISAALSLALASLGQTAADLTAFLGGFVDVHASAASTLSLASASQLSLGALATPVLLAWSANSAAKLVGAWAGGGPRYALLLAFGLIAPVAVAWLVRGWH